MSKPEDELTTKPSRRWSMYLWITVCVIVASSLVNWLSGLKVLEEKEVVEQNSTAQAQANLNSDICQKTPQEPLCEIARQILDNPTAPVEQIPGPPGVQGPQGERGLQGFTGPNGRNGKDGKNGRDGIPGTADDGIDGTNGTDGADGTNGVDGLPGEPGAVGPSGPPGPTGPQGAKGDTGAQGDTGPQGEAGSPGSTGPSGPPATVTITTFDCDGADLVLQLTVNGTLSQPVRATGACTVQPPMPEPDGTVVTPTDDPPAGG